MSATAVGVDTERAERVVGLLVGALIPHLERSHAVVRAAGDAASLTAPASAALADIDRAGEMLASLSRFIDARARGASEVDRVPVMPAAATPEGVASYLDQYLQTGSAHLFAEDIGPNAEHARDLFSHAVRTGRLVERDGWFQPASCGDECASPFSNPASRELLGVENLVEAEAMAEAQIDMVSGGSAIATIQIMRGAFRRFKLDPSGNEPWLDGKPAGVLPRGDHNVPAPDIDLPHSQLGHSRKRKGYSPQAREWDYGENGQLQPIREIDFTDHDKPLHHTNPHQHWYSPNNVKLAPKGGMNRGLPEPL